LNLETFNEEYVRQLTDGESGAGDHFAVYFSNVLELKLRVRLRSPDLVDDIRQETLLRVLTILREGEGVRRPERFGAFVVAVCNNVILEHLRAAGRYEQWDEFVEEPVHHEDHDAGLINADRRKAIEQVLAMVPKKDSDILRAIFLDEIPKTEVCRRFGVDNGYLRVLLHRAKAHFRQACATQDRGSPLTPDKS
jgi:RNA polymerase sigma-70 factor (ECF subfamily)